MTHVAHDVVSLAAAPVETLVSQFEEQVRRSPDAIALECAGVTLTYAEFDRRVNALAHHLVGLGVGPDTLVGLAVHRSIDLVVGMYAILKAGGAYLPIDPDHPVDRIAYVLSVAEPALVLTTAHDEPEFGGAVRTLRIDEFAGPPTPDAPAVVRSADAVAYVIFTSGSTGSPKGVAVTHRAIVANLRWRQRVFRLRADDVVLQKTPFTCDVSVWECFWPLEVGARLVVAAPDGHRDPAYLARVIRESGITVAHFVPSMLAVFVTEPQAAAVDSLRLVFASGEVLPAATAAAFRDICGATLHNLYGLAEAAVDVTAHEVTGADAARVPIGVAADDMELLVLDDSLRPVARGVVGELYLAGVQLARGYLARPGLTAERFVANPDGPAGERMYRTGDLVRWAPGADGGPDELAYLGRTDLRDSLRDRRIEVEAALLEALPLNAGGGLDRRALPEPEFGSAAAVYRAPGAAVAAPARPPLTAEPRPQRVPLSPAQRRVWFLNRFGADAERARDPGAAAVDNIAVALRLRGPLEVSALSAALTDLVARHEVLRTVYPQTADGPVQSVRRMHAVFDLTPADVPEDRLVAAIRRAAGEGFDVAEEIPVRARLLRCGPRDHTLVLVVHHIAADEVSLGPLTRDLATAYAARHEGCAPQWAPLTVQYADYTLWQQRVLGAQTAADSVAAGQLAFWRAELAGLPARLELPADRPRPATVSYRGATHEFGIDAALRADVEAIAARVRATPFTVLHAALAALLARLSGTGDIAIGTLVPGRGAAALDDLVGMFVNTLVLRTEVDGEEGFAGLLARVADRELRAFAHADIPFEQLVEALNPARSAARHPLFQVALRMPDLGPVAPAMPGLETERVDFDPGVAKFDLQLTVSGAAAGYRAEFTYATDLFDPATVREFAAKFVRLLRAAVRDPDAALGDIPLLDASELDYVTASWNASGHKVPDRFLHEGFDAQARRTPDVVALIGDTERLSYAELSDRADRLARMLIGIGVGPEALVVLALPRSVELVVAMYAVARAGGAYVPVDPAHPAERIRHILDTARPQVVLTTKAAGFDAAARTSAPTYHLDDLDLSTYPSGKISDRERLGPLHPLHPAYVIFTAGSTGKPKGVTVSHRAIANQLAWMHAEYRPGTGDVYLQKTASTSDVSLWGYFLPLRAGATLLLTLPERDRDPRYLAETVARERVTLTDFAPSMLAVFAAHARPGELGTLREVFVIGEALSPETVAAFGRVCDARLHNLYGPTEAAVSITNRPVTETDTPLVPIGEPEWNSQVYVLDGRLRPAPIGVPGELYLAGAQLARGYHGRVDRTADRFVANPFGPPGARMYRTGDLARWSRDGELIYLGRTDFQAQRPPASMVPTARVEPAESTSGELDRPALPVPVLAAARFRPPVHAAQRLVAAVFAEVLEVERVGLDDDFFALGGSSLDATQVTARAGAAVGGRVPVRALFDAPTVEGFAAAVERLGRAGATRLPLVRRDRPEPAPLTPAQQRLWFLNRIESQDGADSVYNLPIVLRLTGRLDVTALERAVLDVLARHETLRTSYPETDSGPCRSVLDAADIGLSLHPAPVDRRGLRDAVAGIVRAGFDVTTELPCRVALLAVDRVDESRGLAGDEFVLVFVVHHIAADALSTVPLVTDLFRAYRARLTGRPPDWDALPVRYADYIRWHRELLGAEDAPGDLAYQQLRFWRDVLAGAPAQMPLPADRPRPAVPSYEGAAVDFVIQPEVAAGLRALARRTGAMLFTTLHAAFAATLARLSGSADIVIGTPVGGRGERALDDLVGMFANTLVLRTRVPGDASFTALLADVREGDLAAFANADLPFERLVDAMAVDRTSGAHPLFQVMFGLEAATPEFGGKAVEAPWLSVRPVEIADDGARFDLHLIVRERAGSAELSGTLRYATDLFDAATVESYVARLRRILVAVAVDPDARIGDIELLSDAERHRILREWNATEHPAPESDNLAALFAAQVASTPDAPAITFERTAPGHPSPGHPSASRATLTYAEFAGRVNRLARWLVEQGVGPESLVALGMRRSIDLVVGMYAVTVAGGGYLPLDPDHPAERIAHVLATATPVRVLTAGVDLRCGAAETRIDRLDLSGYSERPLTDADRRAPLRRDNTAYVLFTSGSTGSPKGVVMSHRGIVNRLRWMQSAYVALGPGDVLLQKTPATFDVSVPEFFWPLLVGARMVLARADGHRDPAYLARLIRTEGVTAAHFVPSMLADFVAEALDLPSLREVFCSGEALPVGVAQRMRALTGARVHNGYGPTEAAVEVTFHQVADTDFETVPMGKPIWNTRTYVLDARLRPVPAGVPGELYLAGAQLARGYLGRPEPTANRFVADPFGPPGERMYRTGDLVRWTAAGELEFLGRTDSLVEIRGSRIDFAEIEAALLATSGIAQAAALVRDDRGTGKRLVAYLVTDGPIDIPTVRDTVAARLPGYLVPQAFVVLERFPLSASGKLDRTALPAPAFAPAGFRAPVGAAETLVAEEISTLLGVTEVSAEDDFFALGGDSLGATQLAARLGEAIGAEVAVRTIFDAPTVCALARRIAADGPIDDAPVALPPLTPQERGGPLPLSIGQQRMWLLNRFDAATGAYNIPFALRLTGALNVPALAAAIADVIDRHETLRTIYPEHDGGATQVILPAGTKLVELVARPVPAAQVPELIAAAARAGFDVTAEVPLRVRLLRVEDDARSDGQQVHVLLFVVHHIAADSRSFAPLTRDLANAYVARCAGIAPAPGPPVQYADFAIWQRAALGCADDPASTLSRRLAYWTDRLAGLPEVVTLPSDRPRPAVATHRGGTTTGRLDADLHERIQALATAHRATPFTVLHTALAVLLSRYGAGPDVVIGAPVDGRDAEALDELVGMFVNTLVLRTEVRPEATLAELLASVRAADLAAFDHAAVPFEQVIEVVNPVRSRAHAPLYQVALSLRHEAAPRFRLHRLAIAALELGAAPIQLDLDWALIDHYTADGAPDGIDVRLHYALDLFDEPTAAGFLAAFERVLRAMVRDPRTPVGTVELMSVAERGMLLSDRNATAHALPAETLDDLLTARVAATPDDIGVRYEDTAVTYAEFASRVNRLARRLIEAGVGPERIVGLAASRSIDMLVAMYAIVRAGGAYLPIDPAHPAERLTQLIASAAPRLVLTAGGATLPALDGVPVLDLADLDLGGVPDGPVADAERIAALRPADTAYVLFTSGSTGAPKGVAVAHRAIMHQLRWLEHRYGATASDRILQRAPLTSGLSVWECFLPIAVGAPLVIARPGERLDLGCLADLLRAHRITIAAYPPSVPAALIGAGMGDALRSLRHLHCGGEALTPGLLAALRGSFDGAVHNAYGPAEAAIAAIHRECTDADAASGRDVAIGRPCWNTRAYVLDARLRPVPIGVTGELYLAGDQLARGYHARPGLTAERFVADPFGVPGRVMYRTDDLVRWNRDGDLVYLSRNDLAVELGGRRIRLGEIEAVLAAATGVRNAAVLVARDHAGQECLVGYVTGPGTTPEAVLDQARAQLPAYLVPAHVVVLDEMPLTTVGKLDRSALPAVEFGGTATPFRRPREGTEAVLATLVADATGAARVGADDDFFALGGNSLLAMRLVARANAVLGCALTVREVFEAPTVAGLALRVARSERDAARPVLAPVERPARIPLSPAQTRMWLLHRLDPDSALQYIPITIRLTGALDMAALRSALRDVIGRHESLRTVFPADAEGPAQVVLAECDVPELPLEPVEVTEPDLPDAVSASTVAGFDLTTAIPLRANLFRLAPQDHVLALVVHHIAADGASTAPLTRDLMTAYTARVTGKQPSWRPLPVQYPDFTLWQRAVLASAEDPDSALSGRIAYWRAELAGLAPVLELPADRPRPPVASGRGATVEFAIPADLTGSITALARRHGVSTFMVLHAAYATLLARLAGVDDVAVGTPVAGRGEQAPAQSVGLFADTLVLRTPVAADASFAELLARVRDIDVRAFARADLPFERLVQELNPVRSRAHAPIVQTLLTVEHHDDTVLRLPGLTVSAYPLDDRVARVDLAVELAEHRTETGAALRGVLRYATDLFDQDTIATFGARFLRVLRTVVTDPSVRVGDLELLDDAERALVLDRWNDTAAPVDPAATLISLFETQVARTPDAPAVTVEGRTLTYAEFAVRARRLARWLAGQGVGPDAPVALGMRCSLDLLVGVYAVTLAGGAYVPLDPDHPAERLEYVLSTVRPVCVLTSGHDLDAGVARQVRIDRLHLTGYSGDPLTALDRLGTPEPGHTAYVIFTSGSTGRPKGVAVTHAAIVNRLTWMQSAYPLAADDVVLHKTPATFDASVWEIFRPLAFGARLVVARPDGHRDPGRLARLIIEQRVTTVHFEPTMLGGFLADARSGKCITLRNVFASGEALPAVAAQRARAVIGARVHNLYGPTEAAGGVTCHEVVDTDVVSVPIGRPAADTRPLVLDARMRPVPVGVPGELYLAGAQLARGYVACPELTADRFVADPFGPAGARMYRTGDLVAWRGDGELEYLGRTDFQVRLHGMRIAPGAIEAALLALNAVAQAVALVRADERSGDQLVAYLVASGRAELDIEEVRAALRAALPAYLVPAAFVVLERMPVDASGKLDRAALPAPGFAAVSYRAPATRVEATVARVVANALGVERVGADDDFFALGGDSLIATRVAARLGTELGTEIPVRLLFEAPTVAALAVRADRLACRGDRPALGPRPRPRRIPLAPAQHRMWFLNRFDPTESVRNIAVVVRLTGYLDPDTLAAAVGDLVGRHETLRTVYPDRDGIGYQRILAATEVPGIQRLDAVGALREFVSAPFDLTAEVPLRVGLVTRSDRDHLLALVTHHIAADGFSMRLLARDLATAYAARATRTEPVWNELALQYADYALWQRELLEAEDDPDSVAARRLAYWRRTLRALPAQLDLPADRPRPAVASHAAASATAVLPEEVRAGIATVAARYAATPFMVVHAALATLLARLSGNDDIVIGAPVAGRGDAALGDLVGPFGNTLVLRAQVPGSDTFAAVLRRVREQDLDAFAHADMPFARLVEALDPPRSRARHPLCQIALSFEDFAPVALDMAGVAVTEYAFDHETTAFDLQLTVTGDELRFTYATDLFDAATVETLGARFARLLAVVTADPEEVVGDIDLFGPGELPRVVTARPGAEPSDAQVLRAAYRAPVTPAERVVADVFESVLAAGRIGSDDDFFALGGNSLSATRVSARLADRLGRRVPVRLLFEASTVRELAQLLTAATETVVPLVAGPRPERIPLAPVQRALWSLNRLDPASPAHNIPVALRIEGELDAAALVAAFTDVVARHESLRTVYPADATGSAHQVILPADAGARLTVEVLNGRAVEDRIAEFLGAGFDVTAEVPVRAALLREHGTRHVLVAAVHQLAADDYSMRPLLRDLLAAYHSRVLGADPAWPALAAQYADYAVWQAAELENSSAAQLSYWVETLRDLPGALELPTDRPRPAVASERGASVRARIGGGVAGRVRELARRHDATPFTVVHAALAVLLARLSGSGDIPIGAPMAGRAAAALDELVGMFANTVVLRTRPEEDRSFTDLLAHTKAVDLAAFGNASVPFDQVADALGVERSQARPPLCTVALNYAHSAADACTVPGLEVSVVELEHRVARFDLEFTVSAEPDADGHLAVELDYATDLFDAATASALVRRFGRLLGTLTAAPDRPVAEADLLAPAERAELLGRGVGAPVPPRTLAELMAAAVAIEPDAVALLAGERRLTYRMLDEQSSRLARMLIGHGLGAEDVVAVAVPRSASSVLAVWAVAKTGAAFVPVDPTHPAERIAHSLADSGAALGLTIATCHAALPGELDWLVLDAPSTAARMRRNSGNVIDAAELIRPVRLANPAWISYASGSPKGVVVTHGGLAGVVAAQRDRYQVTADARVLHATSPGFDTSMLELLLALSAGAALVVAPPGVHGGAELTALIRDERVTHAFLTPAVATTLDPAELGCLRLLAVGGEPYGPDTLRRWANGRSFHHTYGPAETTVAATISAALRPGDPLDLGAPVQGMSAVVLDSRMRPVPVGVTGELYLRGPGLARGYHRRPGLAASRFVADPYGPEGGRLYRTGDLVRWNRSGALHYAGRCDRQVRTRGPRVELGEIDAAPAAHETVQTSVTPFDTDSNAAPAGYFTAARPLDPGPSRAAPAEVSPSYMAPAELRALPRTANGKVDRAVLRARDSTPAKSARLAPTWNPATTRTHPRPHGEEGNRVEESVRRR